MVNVLLITNHLRFANQLTQIIEQVNSTFQVQAVALGARKARLCLKENPRPDLIISEIELFDGLAFDVLATSSFFSPVIYFAESDQFALKAFAENGIDFISKSCGLKRIQKSLIKFLQFKKAFFEADTKVPTRPMEPVLRPNYYKSSLLAYYQDKIIPVDLDRTQYLYYGSNSVSIYTDHASYETRDTLNNIIHALDPNDFFRANRQFIIHRRAVKTIKQYFGRKLLVGISIETPEPVVISKANATEFLKWMEGVQYTNELPTVLKRSA